MNKIYNYCVDNLEMLFNDKNLKDRFMKFSKNTNDIQYILDQSHFNVRLGETENDIKKLYEKID